MGEILLRAVKDAFEVLPPETVLLRNAIGGNAGNLVFSVASQRILETADTRVAVPIYVDPLRNTTRTWLVLGVRLAKLDAGYALPPSVKRETHGNWAPAEAYELGEAEYLIPVDEFAEVQLRGQRVLTREELRAVCDRAKTVAVDQPTSDRRDSTRSPGDGCSPRRRTLVAPSGDVASRTVRVAGRRIV